MKKLKLHTWTRNIWEPLYPETYAKLVNREAGGSVEDSLKTIEQTLIPSKLDKAGGIVTGNLAVAGDFTVNGTTHIQDTVTLRVKDNVIVANTDGLDLLSNAGFAIRKNADTTYGIMYDPAEDVVKIGAGSINSTGTFSYTDGEAQSLATRADNIQEGHLVKWSSANNTLVDAGAIAQTVGQSTTEVMSQKATTNELYRNYYNLSAFDNSASNGNGTGSTLKKSYTIIMDNYLSGWEYDSDRNYWVNERVSFPKPNGAQYLLINKSGANMTLLETGKKIIVSPINTSEEFLLNFLRGCIAQYELAPEYHYEENVIDKQPIRLLPQDGELWIDNEWRKGLNLCKTAQVFPYQDFFELAPEGYLPAGTYTILITTSQPDTNANQIIGGGIVQAESLYVYANTPRTFSTKDTSRLQIYLNASNTTSIMLVKGSHPYPYEPYHGEIVRQKELEDAIASAITTTLNTVV